jgi:predicted Fe-Mo cluster-binding NifX family protein
MIVAVPSDAPGGLDAPISEHFGHCAAFTMVEIDGGQVGRVAVMPNTGHVQGGCMAPVMMLKQLGADAMVAGGMGQRPLAGFQQVGIDVYFREDAVTVDDAIKLMLAGKARVFGPAQTCGGGGGGGDGSGGGCGGH